MAKKLTKKELKALEEKQKELRSLRNEYVEAINGFWRDCDTTLNYYKLNGNDITKSSPLKTKLDKYESGTVNTPRATKTNIPSIICLSYLIIV